METKLVCFDLDDTLVREIHSVMLPCLLNGKALEHSVIQQQEEAGRLNYIQADYKRAKLLKGLEEKTIASNFLKIAKPLRHINQTVSTLHHYNIKCIVVTVGPIQVAKVVADIWEFDGYYGSNYEVKNGIFTGEIKQYINVENKVDCLIDYCQRHSIKRSECLSVGDGSTDIPLFEYCGKSIALNASEKVKATATYSVDTDDLKSILQFVLKVNNEE